MSALPIVIPEFSAVPENSRWAPRPHLRPGNVRPSSVTTPSASIPGSLRLTDRGIALIMLLAAVILTAALAVIGMTALRVTGAGYDAGSQGSQQAQR
jgi:hypothetical protein